MSTPKKNLLRKIVLHRNLINLIFMHVLFIPDFLFSAVMDLSENKTQYSNVYSQIYTDKSQSLEIKDLLKPSIEWDSFSNIGSYLYSGPKTYWMRFKVKNTDENSVEYVFTMLNTLVHFVDLYKVKGQEVVRVQKSGVGIQPELRPLNHQIKIAFELNMEPKEEAWVYLKINNYSSRITNVGIIKSRTNFKKYQNIDTTLRLIFYGIALTIIILNIIVFLMTKIKSFGFYSIFLTMALLQVLGLDGVIDYYFWFPSEGWWRFHPDLMTFPTIVAVILFTKSFFSISENNKSFFFSSQIVYIGSIILFSITSLGLVYQYSLGYLKVAELIPILGITIVLKQGISYILKGFRPAIFFVLSYLFLSLATMLLIFSVNNIIPINEYSMLWLHLGITVEIFFGSLSLGDKVRLIYKEHINAKEESLYMLNQLRDAEIEAEKRKWQALTTVANGFAHEINNPLAIINGYARKIALAHRNKLPESDINGIVEKIQMNVKRASHSVAFLTEITTDFHIESNEFIEVDDFLDQFISKISSEFAISPSQIQKEKTLTLELGIPMNTLFEALKELIKNGLESGGNETNFKIKVASTQDSLEILISNNGPLIPKDFESYIFDPFFSSKGVNFEGKGLSLAKRKLNQVGGDIFLRQNKEKIEFLIRLQKHVRNNTKLKSII